MKKKTTATLTAAGIFTALVVLAQLVSGLIRIGSLTVTFALLPIIVGAALYGRKMGAWLGFVLALVILLDGGTAPFYAINWYLTVILVVAKTTVAGYVAGLIYPLLAKKNEILAAVVTGTLVPVINTGIFLVFCLVAFRSLIPSEASGFRLIADAILLYCGGNFLVEVLVNLTLSTVVIRVVRVVRRSRRIVGEK